MEENKIFEVGSLLCISVMTKLTAVGGDLHRFKDEKAIEMVYTSLKEVFLWRFCKETHTQSTGNLKKAVICVLALHEC